MSDFQDKKNLNNPDPFRIKHNKKPKATLNDQKNSKSFFPKILMISSYPPRECGIATYSQDLLHALDQKFGNSFLLRVCALENGEMGYAYPSEVEHVLNTSIESSFLVLADTLNKDASLKIVFIQHEFGLFYLQEAAFLQFLKLLKKPVIVSFHSVLPSPDRILKEKIISIADACEAILVMTNKSSQILNCDYGIAESRISVIPHGTHLVLHLDKAVLKEKYNLANRKVLSTFGLLSSGKGIETTLKALPSIVNLFPEVIFLIIGKTHPNVVKTEGEMYRKKLVSIVKEYHLEEHVRFINSYLELPELLEYLQLTDIYLFTSNDPNQAVSGTFAYAMSCACPIISTPIPHAREVLDGGTGIIIDFGNSGQLTNAVNRLLDDEELRITFARNALQKIVSTAWENSAIAHALLLGKMSDEIKIIYSLPEIKLDHVQKMTTDFGMIQFSKINQPDIDSGYTLDDNARALIAFSRYYEMTRDESSLKYMRIYLAMIRYCQMANGRFLNYVDQKKSFTSQNHVENLDDSNGRALCALSHLLTIRAILPQDFISDTEELIEKALEKIESIHSPRAMALVIRALYWLKEAGFQKSTALLLVLADRLVQMYHREAEPDWSWFENYLTYSNSVLPEAMAYAWLVSEKPVYREIALESLDFLLSITFKDRIMSTISNKTWHIKGSETDHAGEQSIDVAVTIETLSVFYDVFGEEEYYNKMRIAFDWFLGNNRLHQIIYNPCTGGCFDGLEESHVNLNEGAESSLSYLTARLTIEKYRDQPEWRGLFDKRKRKESGSLMKKERI